MAMSWRWKGNVFPLSSGLKGAQKEGERKPSLRTKSLLRSTQIGMVIEMPGVPSFERTKDPWVQVFGETKTWNLRDGLVVLEMVIGVQTLNQIIGWGGGGGGGVGWGGVGWGGVGWGGVGWGGVGWGGVGWGGVGWGGVGWGGVGWGGVGWGGVGWGGVGWGGVDTKFLKL